jgi:hypothetical protein
MTLTRKKFVQWLRDQEPGREFERAGCYTCPIAEFLTALHKYTAHVTKKSYVVWPATRARAKPLPRWARDFITLADRQESRKLTVADCLELTCKARRGIRKYPSNPEPRFIVKVQLSAYPAGRVLIYNKDRSLRYECNTPPDLEADMGDEMKAFRYAHMEGTILHLDEDAPWQDW